MNCEVNKIAMELCEFTARMNSLHEMNENELQTHSADLTDIFRGIIRLICLLQRVQIVVLCDYRLKSQLDLMEDQCELNEKAVLMLKRWRTLRHQANRGLTPRTIVCCAVVSTSQ